MTTVPSTTSRPTLAAVDLREHGDRCSCDHCGTIRLFLDVDKWAEAVHAAFEAGVIDEFDLELAWRSGVDVMLYAGFLRGVR